MHITVPSFLVPPTHNEVLGICNRQIKWIKQEVRQTKEILRWNWWSHILGPSAASDHGHGPLVQRGPRVQRGPLVQRDSTILQHDLVMQGSNAARRKECFTVTVAWEERPKLPKEFTDLFRPGVGIGTSPCEKWFEWIDIVVGVRY